MSEQFVQKPQTCPPSGQFQTAASVRRVDNFGTVSWEVTFGVRCIECGALFEFEHYTKGLCVYSQQNRAVSMSIIPVKLPDASGPTTTTTPVPRSE